MVMESNNGRQETLYNGRLSDMTTTTEQDQLHGTYAAFQRHKRDSEQPCDLCRAARNDYMRQFRKSHPQSLTAQVRQEKLRRQAQTILAKRHHREYLEILTMLKELQAGSRS